jgi:transcriptional regulator with XRE-family HTH domain
MTGQQRIGIVIRRARERKHWTQQQLADAAGVSRTTVDAWENNRSWPRNRIGAIEDILGVSLGGEAAPARGLAAGDMWEGQELDEWEASVLGDRDLPDELRRQLVSDSRHARAAYDAELARRAREAGQAEDPAGRGRAAG